ncbi:thioredoxin family protein [Kurthia sp. YJT4]|uniref:thioredoxin family protein n=1 Tax=Kurthia sp. YJT4 TaxID=3049086 RepID=UPI002550C2FA|nr:thioredoxin family protein [Kurthia sp. YJT4]WIL37950.1 thioredoxin family protein [Kurthia sp. YJT4]
MQEWTREQWEEQVKSQEKTAFYLYTPMCGTCQVALRMMDVTEQAIEHVSMGKANLNYMEQLAYDFEIESVPCLLITQNGELVEKIYAFQSVPHLFEKILKKY